MKPRVLLARVMINLGRCLVRIGRFIDSLAIMVMRPDDLVEFSRRYYGKPEEVGHWCSEDFVGQGLNPLEKALLKKVPIKKGRLLILGVEGGREAIPLARLGFEVTGVDFVPEMVHKAQENAARHGIHIQGIVQEVSKLDLPEGSYDIAWLANSMYSSPSHAAKAGGRAAAPPPGPQAWRLLFLLVSLGKGKELFHQS